MQRVDLVLTWLSAFSRVPLAIQRSGMLATTEYLPPIMLTSPSVLKTGPSCMLEADLLLLVGEPIGRITRPMLATGDLPLLLTEATSGSESLFNKVMGPLPGRNGSTLAENGTVFWGALMAGPTLGTYGVATLEDLRLCQSR